MRNHQLRLDCHRHRLGRDPTGPENRNLPGFYRDRVAEIRFVHIPNPDRRRLADMQRRAMNPGKTRSHLHRTDGQLRPHRPHADNSRAMKKSGRTAGDIRQIHRHIALLFNMADRYHRLEQRRFKGKTATDQKCHQIVPPILGHIGRFIDQLAIFPDPVLRDIVAQIGARTEQPWLRRTDIRHVKNRAGFGVALAKQQKIIGQVLRHNCQIRLYMALAESCRWPDQLIAAD